MDPAAFRARPADFSRSGVLAPDVLLGFLLFQSADAGRSGYRGLLEEFWDSAKLQGVPLPCEAPVSAAALCQARAKLPSSAVREVLHQVTGSFGLVHGERFLWKGRRLLAADGTVLALQRTEALFKEFGALRHSHHPSAHVLTLYDVLAGLPLDVAVGDHVEQDRAALPELLKQARKGDVLLLDRGFPSYDLLAWLLSEGIEFVVRLPIRARRFAMRFVASGVRDGPVAVTPTMASVLKDGDSIELRAVRTEPAGAEPCVVLTSLREDEASAVEIAALYGLRWEIEEHYKTVQSDHFGQRSFHARTPEGVRQEVYAQALLLAVSRHLAASAAEHAGIDFDAIQTKAAINAAAARITRFALAGLQPADLVALLERIARVLEPKRHGRNFERRSFKRQSEWGPYGKRRTAKRGDSPAEMA